MTAALPGAALDWRRHAWAWAAPAVAAGLVGLGLMLGWRGVDLSAQLYRIALVRNDGFTIWDSQWYGGHWTLDYSVLFPPLAAMLGVATVAVLGAAAAALAFDRVLVARFAGDPTAALRLASLLFAASTVVQSAIGQLPFLMGEALALCCCWAASRRRWAVAVALAVLTALVSPLAAAFLVIAAGAWLTGERPRRAWPVAAIAIAAALPVGATALLFPGQGTMPYPVVDWLWEVVVALGLWAVTPPRWRAIRAGTLLVAAAATASVLIPSPFGGNVGRIEDCLALPLAVLALWQRRRLLLGLLAVPLVFSQWAPAWGAMTTDNSQPSTHQAYYTPLVRYLEHGNAPIGRVEVIPTKYHWEATYVALSVPLARGWERQLDEADNPIFYRPGLLDDATYRAWLIDNGVRWVALPDAPLDYAATGEAQLVEAGVPGLRLLWASTHWRVYAVAASTGILSGPARLTEVRGDDVRLEATGKGPVLVRVRWSQRWSVSEGDACVASAPGGWTELHVAQPGPIRLDLRLIGRSSSECVGS